jgi:hypothetical protein
MVLLRLWFFCVLFITAASDSTIGTNASVPLLLVRNGTHLGLRRAGGNVSHVRIRGNSSHIRSSLGNGTNITHTGKASRFWNEIVPYALSSDVPRAGKTTLLFVHIPKTAGSSMERVLQTVCVFAVQIFSNHTQ